MREAGGHAGGLAFGHAIDAVVIAAYAADQIAADHLVAPMEGEALAARVEDGAHFAVHPAREHEAKSFASVVGVAEELGAAGSHRGDVYAHFVLAGYDSAVRSRGEEQESRCGRERRAAQYFRFAQAHEFFFCGQFIGMWGRCGRLNSSPLNFCGSRAVYGTQCVPSAARWAGADAP